MTGIEIEERNAYNTLIELAVKTGKVLWTITQDLPGVPGGWVEHINGKYTGTAHTAGFASGTSWIENDYKSLFGHETANDWGIASVISEGRTHLAIQYSSYKKGKFNMTLELQGVNMVV